MTGDGQPCAEASEEHSVILCNKNPNVNMPFIEASGILVSLAGFMIECFRAEGALKDGSDEDYAEPDGPGILFVSEGI